MCIESALSQSYKNYKILFVDDSSDYTKKQKEYIKEKLDGHETVFNKKRRYSIYSGYQMIKKYAKKKDSVILVLDGDDWLLDENVLNYLNKVYSKNSVYLTYGECLVWDGNKTSKKTSRYIRPNSNLPYPKSVINEGSFRKEPFYPSHPMTFKTWLFNKIDEKDFKEPDGTWLKYSLDLASFLPMLEMANGRFKAIKKPLSIYNTGSPKINTKVNPYEFVREDLIIRKTEPYEPLK